MVVGKIAGTDNGHGGPRRGYVYARHLEAWHLRLTVSRISILPLSR